MDRVYPRQNAALHEEIADAGLLLSQFWPGATPTKQSFPIRNVTMSAYCGVTIIVAANENSGTKHQATAAARHGKTLLVSHEVATATTWGRAMLEHGQALPFKSVSSAVEQAVQLLRRKESHELAWA